MLKILGRASSINVRKVLWTCHELGLEPVHEEWGRGELLLDAPAFRRLNPAGLVPVLVEDAEGGQPPFVLTESNTICRYLAARHPASGLLPAGARERARVEQWMDWQATELNNAWRYAFMALVRRSPAHTDGEAVQASITQWNRQMALLDSALSQTGAYVCGSTLTLADVVLGLSTERWLATPFEKPALPAVQHFHALLCRREGFLRHGHNGEP